MNSNEKQDKEVKSNFEEINCEESKVNEQSAETDDTYKFGWSSYSEITNGRFAMLGFLAIILIELFSQKSFLSWAGIF
tara:strand:- start:424 stop:657 length:234 start_codon:yes stop_codon:yes gene_type:complete